MEFDFDIDRERPIKKKDHIIVIADRSGSMITMVDAAEEGINGFIVKQREAKADNTVVSIFEFDDEYDPVCERVDIRKAPRYKLEPRGSTALFDAIGKTINGYKVPEGDNVYVAICTDGKENASREFQSRDMIKKLVKQKEDEGWEFIFLATNMDAYAEGGDMGFSSANTVNFVNSDEGMRGAYTYASAHIGNMRTVGKEAALSMVDDLKQNTSGVS